MNIKDLDPNLLQNLIDQMENLHPGLLQSLNDKEADKRCLCQQEQNLTEDLSKAKAYCNKLRQERGTEMSKCLQLIHDTNQRMDDIGAEYDPQIDAAEGKCQTLEKQLEQVHKEYISKYPSSLPSSFNPAPKPVQKPNLHEAFHHMCSYFLTNTPDSCGSDKAMEMTLFKRFDNLIHARCRSTELFGYDWTIDDIYTFFCNDGRFELASHLRDFYKSHISNIH